ncbi:MAG: hypothetical protein A2840_00370 [Candidatus Buchananbacteria bacterium RIFCSPHIGHO2_01_FULL_47_11b]|uniref:Magnesium transporter CorA n=1 Tax=Candidatus Buchananbacteria bacterium RIFCSPHIGHO2_01_FULL_47_11b TaxID=1797537 RepID=A0A1G1Y4L6_9BACT|nr:MAG: hypothetical protein A2840_00370 [Candidatus Buchananbacteria bacterium RIFCSPHIGHO2_01_FULL_47_11b]
MTQRTLKHGSVVWYNITDFSPDDLKFLKSNFKFHPLDLKDCAGEPQRSKIDVYKNYVFIVLQLPDYQPDGVHVEASQFYIFLSKDYIVTITKGKFKFLNNFYYKVVNNLHAREHIFGQGSEYLLYRILDYVLRQRWKALFNLDDHIRRIELEIDEGQGKRAVLETAALRRTILQFKSILDPQRLVINTLSKLSVSFISKDSEIYFDDIDDYVDKVWFALESYRDRVISLQEINESLISYRTNKIMTLLTVFSVALLPLTFLTGLYGMNIDLPLGDRPVFVWSIFGLLAAMITIIIYTLRRKDWI